MKAGFKSFLVYRLLAPEAVSMPTLAERLAYLPAGDPAPSQMQRSGFVPTITGEDALLTDLGHGVNALTLQTALRIVPNKVVKRELEKRVKQWEQTYARVPTASEKAALKNDVITALMENALIDYSRVNVLISGPTVYVETSSVKKAELVLGAIRRVLGSLLVQPLTPIKPVVDNFTSWVAKKTEPKQLKVGEAFKAKGRLEGGQVLSGKSVDLDDSTLSELLEQDYQVVALELNYYNDGLHGTTDFMLTEDLAFRSVSWPDALVDMAEADAGEDETGINVAKATLLLTGSALDDLVDGVMVSLGGEAIRDVSDKEREDSAAALKGWSVSVMAQQEPESPAPQADDEEWRDALYQFAVNWVIEVQKASTTSLQRQFSIGYSRASRMIEQMEKDGIIGPSDENGGRDVLIEEGTYEDIALLPSDRKERETDDEGLI